MAKPKEEETRGQLATLSSSVPAELLKEMEQDAGAGISFAAEDSLIPMVILLQANSPQVKPRDPKYLENARDGDIWMRGSLDREVIPGDEGFSFQPCSFEHAYIEWLPNRGGFAGRHTQMPPDAALKAVQRDDGSVRNEWVRENGNIVQEVREHYGLANRRPYMISFFSTGHTVSRDWMGKQKQVFFPGTNKVVPAFGQKWRLTTFQRSNNKGQSWSSFKVAFEGIVTDTEEYRAGKALHESLKSGEKRAADYESPAAAGTEEVLDDKIPF